MPRVILFDVPGAPQSNIVAARVIDTPYRDGYTEFDLANVMYGGNFTSRINTNLREEKGWSYGVRSSVGMSVGPRIWQIVAQVQTDKTAESISELLSELSAINGDRPFTRAVGLVRAEVEKAAEGKRFIFGHSMGGLVGLLALLFVLGVMLVG